jgi:Fe-S oxidoreductase
LATAAAGLAPREIPLFAGQSLQQWFLRRGGSPAGPRGSVLLWPDTFTNYFHPHIGQAAVEVLEDAGWQVTMPAESLCCGLTWISTGQLATAKKVLRRTVDMLTPHVQAGRFIVGLEPSCTSVFRSDAADLLGGDDRVARIAEKTVTLAELLTGHTPGWRPPRLDGIHAIAQVHCHQHAVLGWAADQQLLDDAGALAQPLASGCCGLAGNFGFEPGHLDVSTACAESVLLPAVRSAAPHTVVLADGFSCRTQIHELDSGGREAIHLAELLHRAAIGSLAPSSDLAAGDRPTLPRPATRAAAFGATAVTAAALLAAAAAALRVMLKSKHHRST